MKNHKPLAEGKRMDARWGPEWVPALVIGPARAGDYLVEVEVPGPVKVLVTRRRGELRYPKRMTRRQRDGGRD